MIDDNEMALTTELGKCIHCGGTARDDDYCCDSCRIGIITKTMAILSSTIPKWEPILRWTVLLNSKHEY